MCLLSACVTPPQSEPLPPQPEVQKKPSTAERAQSAYESGLASYQAGHFEEAATQLREALRLGLDPLSSQINAHKHLAFIECLASHKTACRESFKVIFSLDPNFELSRSEAGHPLWGPVYRSVQKEQTQPPGKPTRRK